MVDFSRSHKFSICVIYTSMSEKIVNGGYILMSLL